MFTYDALNAAFRALIHGAEFFALARNRNFLDADGELSLDVGGFVAALEYACGRRATVIGKPSPEFFHAAVAALNIPARNVLMVGDDAEADVGGAMAAGLRGALVKTGKYRAGQEQSLASPPDLVADDLAAIVKILPRSSPCVPEGLTILPSAHGARETMDGWRRKWSAPG